MQRAGVEVITTVPACWAMLKWKINQFIWKVIILTIGLPPVSMGIYLFPLCPLQKTVHGMVGWMILNWRSSLMTGSLNSSDQLGKTGWGELMCNTLLCPNDYCQHATEQGRHCVAGRAKLSGLEPLLDPCERVTHKLLTQILHCWIKLHWLSNHFYRVATISYLERAGTGTPFLWNNTAGQTGYHRKWP